MRVCKAAPFMYPNGCIQNLPRRTSRLAPRNFWKRPVLCGPWDTIAAGSSRRFERGPRTKGCCSTVGRLESSDKLWVKRIPGLAETGRFKDLSQHEHAPDANPSWVHLYSASKKFDSIAAGVVPAQQDVLQTGCCSTPSRCDGAQWDLLHLSPNAEPFTYDGHNQEGYAHGDPPG
eukprot:scaffold80_cov325-Pavlova_lutheri.AAC.25